MRLLNTHSLELREFTGSFFDMPRYCILSHRWGDDEVTYKEFRKGLKTTGEGYRKIVNFCEFVRSRADCYREMLSKRSAVWEGIEWVWVDTCCIDKRSSSELSEAINSMYKYYQCAFECIVYMRDVADEDSVSTSGAPRGFVSSDWFTRSWTLQELIAPRNVIFCNYNWNVLGHQAKCWPALYLPTEYYGYSLLPDVSRSTGIPEAYLSGHKQLSVASIAQRMSWARTRQASRIEDIAYSLLGIFNINMPLIYGEGRRAFVRLQEEIARRSTDQSLFAWQGNRITLSLHPPGSIFAHSPIAFRDRDYSRERCHLFSTPYTVTNNGLQIQTKQLATAMRRKRRLFRWTLNYSRTGDSAEYVFLEMVREPNVFARASIGNGLSQLPWKAMDEQLIFLNIEDDLVREPR